MPRRWMNDQASFPKWKMRILFGMRLRPEENALEPLLHIPYHGLCSEDALEALVDGHG